MRDRGVGGGDRTGVGTRTRQERRGRKVKKMKDIWKGEHHDGSIEAGLENSSERGNTGRCIYIYIYMCNFTSACACVCVCVDPLERGGGWGGARRVLLIG